MLLLVSTSDKITVTTDAAVDVDIHASYLDFDGTNVVPGRKNTKVTTATTVDAIAVPPSSTYRNIKSLLIQNVHATLPVKVTVSHTDGTFVIQLESVVLLAGERLALVEGQDIRVYDVNGLPKTNASASAYVQRLAADLSNSTTVAAKVTGLDIVMGIGTWQFTHYILYQSSAAGTGIKLGCNHTGTVSSFVYDVFGVQATTTASDGTMSQAVVATTGGIVVGWSQRVKSTNAPVITAGADLANSDMLIVIRGLVVVTASGNLETYHASETAVATTIKAGSNVRLTKMA
jgi:hypothetical protein